MSDAQTRTSDALRTYRYLRIGMLSAVVLLATSVVMEGVDQGCWQTSISAYFYTPARSVVVGVLLAVGFAMIVIKGRGSFEDTACSTSPGCSPRSSRSPRRHLRGGDATCPTNVPPADELTDAIQNNIWALLITGVVCLGIGLVIAVILNRSIVAPITAVDDGTWKTLVAASVAVAVAVALKARWDDFDTLAHGWAARLMFVCMFGAAVSAAWEARRTPRNAGSAEDQERAQRRYAALYLACALGMFLTGALVLVTDLAGRHEVLVLESTEIFWFGFFWAVQTAERWDEPPVGSTAEVAAA